MELNSWIKRSYIALFLASSAAFVGCSDRTGENAERTAESSGSDAEENAEEAGEAVEEGVNDAAQEVEDATDDDGNDG